MRATTSHIVETGSGLHYEYDLFEFEASGAKYVVRSYTSEPDEAHFLRKEVGGQSLMLAPSDTVSTLFRDAELYLRQHGKTRLTYLSGVTGDYVDV